MENYPARWLKRHIDLYQLLLQWNSPQEARAHVDRLIEITSVLPSQRAA